MAEETIIVPESKVRYKGIFSFTDFYRFFVDTFRTLGYTIDEEKYRHKEKADSTEIEIVWNCYKNIDDYTRFLIKAKILVVDMKKVQIQKEGVTTTADSGDIEITFTARLVTDYLDRWETSPILKFVKGIYDRYLYKPTFESYKKRIVDEMYTTENETKSFFNLARFM
jgi:hypothetical protein